MLGPLNREHRPRLGPADRQAFLNLIHNAIKYAPDGGSILVQVHGEPQSPVEIHIRDNGPGIPANHRGRIFDRFSRSSHDQSGAGLGLAIAKWILIRGPEPTKLPRQFPRRK